MRSIIFLSVSLIYLNFLFVRAQNENHVPVFLYSKVSTLDKNDFTFPIGSYISANQFVNYLDKIYPAYDSTKGKKKIAVILVSSLEAIDFENHKEFELNAYFLPSAHSGYTLLIDDLNTKYVVDIFQHETLKDGQKRFNDIKRNHRDYVGIAITKLDIDNPVDDQHPAKDRVKRQNLNVQLTNGSTQIFGDECAAVFNSIYIVNSTVSGQTPLTKQLNVTSSSFKCCSNCTNSSAVLTLSFASDVSGEYITEASFIFSPINSVWRFTNSTIKTNNRSLEAKYMEYNFDAPISYSFACTSTRFKLFDPTNPKARLRIELYIKQFQFQPFGVKNNQVSFTFGRVSYCTGFFTNGILMGITSSLLMAFIVAIGVYLMTSINTMDRFDDPKGKQLTIAAEK